MADKIQEIFGNRKINLSKLAAFGFERSGEDYVFTQSMPESGFVLTVSIDSQGRISTRILDPATDEPYTLHLADGAVGSFVGRVRSRYEETLTEIADKCFEPEVFQFRQTKDLIAHVRETYGDELEFLWKKLSDSAVWRRKDTGKWYAVLLTLSRRKLGMDSDEIVEIIDFRMPPEELADLVDNERYFPGYHMNKKHWCTIVLDGSVELGEICRRVEQSYILAVK